MTVVAVLALAVLLAGLAAAATRFQASRSAGRRLRRLAEAARSSAPGLVSAWFTADARTLAAFRMALGVLLCIDLLRRLPWLDAMYSDAGFVPNQGHDWTPLHLGLLRFVESPLGVRVFAAASLLVHASLAIGLRTRLAQVLSLVAVLSFDKRNLLVLNSGNVLLGLLLLWTLFLPLGRRWSIDALRRRAAGVERSSDRVTGPVVLVLLLQLALVYLLNALHKTDEPWLDGSAVHFALHVDRHATTLGTWLRGVLPVGLGTALTWGTLLLEATAPVLILSPVGTKRLRRAALVLLGGFHLGIAATMNVGLLSWAMLCYLLLLCPAEDLERLRVLVSRACPQRASRRLRALLERTAASSPSPRAGLAPLPRGPVAVALLSLLSFTAGSQALRENAFLRNRIEVSQPWWAHHLACLLDLRQSWTMFAPVDRFDGWLSVDVRTSEGRRLDPFQGEPTRFLANDARRLRHDQFWTTHGMRLSFQPGTEAQREALRAWLSDERNLAGLLRDGESVIGVDAWWIMDRSPSPGAEEPNRRFLCRSLFTGEQHRLESGEAPPAPIEPPGVPSSTDPRGWVNGGRLPPAAAPHSGSRIGS